MPFKYPDAVSRLMAHSVPAGYGECWIWIGATLNNGRPCISVRIAGRVVKMTVARFIVQYVHCEKWGRNLSRRKVGAHSCDNLSCANPAHVRKSTQKRNVQECVKRGRHRNGASSQSGLAK